MQISKLEETTGHTTRPTTRCTTRGANSIGTTRSAMRQQGRHTAWREAPASQCHSKHEAPFTSALFLARRTKGFPTTKIDLLLQLGKGTSNSKSKSSTSRKA
ncbi:hypothetical protein HAX54_022839 [Datura stramonium]|uniref:Uncharacterized protein n=1 Tax=Datura stramonium TaxID=4076 RepID=A0ABS8UV62_DATST|nr:hypothetical protein [Datura stramonium]